MSEERWKAVGGGCSGSAGSQDGQSGKVPWGAEWGDLESGRPHKAGARPQQAGRGPSQDEGSEDVTRREGLELPGEWKADPPTH